MSDGDAHTSYSYQTDANEDRKPGCLGEHGLCTVGESAVTAPQGEEDEPEGFPTPLPDYWGKSDSLHMTLKHLSALGLGLVFCLCLLTMTTPSTQG